MGQMKKFGVNLARMVYIRRMKDKDIVSFFIGHGITDEEWIRNQIQIVRSHPEIYRTMMGAK